ncbi:MAG: 16S rRNA (cytosine(1402)-N(4))-methyltransferase RsmH [Bacteroidales bacterium]|jgi:16S rRNA (cytosine1402-N4)-methyltransferase|nr:16S rRNA (cytosine(1402)-N(4))-methyltransferase RsmH [Bacteroidales bacterium]NPV35143.1 16S rRNA (cytosine(1402)-N(4))-methyltransferase RsmH [Bacteroidales bacterium]
MSYHLPVLLKESVNALLEVKGEVWVDVTFGGGGHTREILSRMGKGCLVAFDQDADALANVPDDERLIFVNENFRFLKRFLRFYNVIPVDGILADLGVSSWQIDEPHKGFSTRYDAPADMRMDRRSSLTAAGILAGYTEEDLFRIFREYGELPNARQIASRIAKLRQQESIDTTGKLREVLLPLSPRGAENKFLAQVFQALRIEVNQELDALKDLLLQSAEVLRPGGRLVIISYHSLEDRLVKNFMKTGTFDGEPVKDFYGNLMAPFRPVHKKPLEASAEEIACNPRARSAKLRIAEKL